MKMLSLDDAIKAVTMLLDDEDRDGRVWASHVIDNLKNAPSVTDVEPTQKWISVNDRLPEDEYECIVVIEGKWIGIGWFHGSKEKWIVDGESYVNGYVTHWMAIPDLPEEDENAPG